MNDIFTWQLIHVYSFDPYSERAWGSKMSMPEDGQFVMGTDAQCNWMGRTLLSNDLFYTKQLKLAADFRIDPTQYLGSMSYNNDAGKRVTLNDWEYAPDGSGTTGDTTSKQFQVRQQADLARKSHCNRQKMFMAKFGKAKVVTTSEDADSDHSRDTGGRQAKRKGK